MAGEDDVLRYIRRIRPQAEIGLADPTGGLPVGGPSLPKVFSRAVELTPANTNEEMFTPQQPDRRGVSYFLTPIQQQRLREMGFPEEHIKYTSPEQARDIIQQDDLIRAGLPAH